MSPEIPPHDSYRSDDSAPVVDGRESVLPSDDGPVHLTPDEPVVRTINTGLWFTLVNGGEAEFGWNPCDWGLFRYTNGAWDKLAPEMVNQPYSQLQPGETHRYHLGVRGPSGDGQPDYCGQKQVSDLPPGKYAFCLYGSYAGGEAKTYVAPVTVEE